MESIKKLISIFRNPELSYVYNWSKCVHKRVIGICTLNAVASICSLASTITTKVLIDGAVSSNTAALWKYGIILGSIIIFEFLLYMTLSMIGISTSAKLQRSMQKMLVRELMLKDYTDIKKYHSGDLVNRFFSDISVVKNGVVELVPSIISTLVSFIGAAIILIYMDWRFVLLLVIGGMIGLGMILLFRNPMKQRHILMQEAEGALHASAQETLENIRLIKASVSEKRAEKQLDNRQEGLESEQIRQGRVSAEMNQGIGLVFDLSWFFCMMWGCISISKGKLTYGSLAAIIQLIGRIQGPISNSVSIAAEAYAVIASAERLQELIGLPSEEEGEELSQFDSILIRDVTFQYDDGDEDVLRTINCTIENRDFVAMTGISGGGKSSLFQLLLGIYKPTVGEVVFVCGDKRVNASRGTRGLFAYVPQGNTLFSGSLRENLLMFTDSASDEEIAEACKIACVDDLIQNVGLDAKIGERGGGLSEGQAQRVGIARALLSGAPILLFDEATSALDEETEARLLRNISEMREKTCIIVTHRKAALDICDYRLHISAGEMTKEMLN